MRKYIWMGPPTVAEIYPEGEGEAKAPLFSGALVTGGEIPADLPDDHPQVISWRAFKLIEPVVERRIKDKEKANG